MYLNEFKEEVEKLSSKYCVGGNQSYVTVYYLANPYRQAVISVANNLQYSLEKHVASSKFDKLPFGRKLYMLSSELAVTPVLERDEGLKEEAKRHKQEHVVDSLTRHIARQARVTQHVANSPQYRHLASPSLSRKSFGESFGKNIANAFNNDKEYTGIKDAKGNPIYVGDSVVEVFNYKDIPNMPDFKSKGKPFVVKKDCYLYSHWISSGVSEGASFGIDNFLFGDELLKCDKG